MSKSNFVSSLLGKRLDAEVPLEEVARSIDSHMSRRWKSGSLPAIFCASSQTSECTPSTGFQWNLTKVDLPSALTSRNVWTPKPSIMAEAARNGAVAHDPHDHVHRLGRQRDEVVERVVGGRRPAGSRCSARA